MPNYTYDANHVRYELVSTHEGKNYNWLFIPGGPGASSSYFHTLVKLLELPGNVWLIDFPGNGDNLAGVSPNYNFDAWFDIFLPMVDQFENPIIVGHSFGAMLPLCYPELEHRLKGFVILNSAPSLWLQEALAYSKQFNLPDLSKEMMAFTFRPNQQTFQTALNACIPYYFSPHSLEKGRALIGELPFQFSPAVWWQRKSRQMNYSAKWIPQAVPTLIVGATYDCMCPYTLFERDGRFHRPNIEMLKVENGGHFPWIENPKVMQAAFKKFCERL